MTESKRASRRDFVVSSAGLVGAAVLSSRGRAEKVGVHQGVDETIRLGLIGCGRRGQHAVLDAMAVDPRAQLVVAGDVFADRAERCVSDLQADQEYGSRIAVDPENIISGFDNYKHVIDACDVVLLAAPPHFRPKHLAYAVEQGKHMFVEKPIAVDAPGVRSVMSSCQIARVKGLSVVSGLCWRYDYGVRETMRQILEEKRIGDIIAIESSYNSKTLWHRGDHPEWSRMEYQLRNWLYYTWLSGDHILEQAVHSLDKTAWLLGDTHPSKAMGIGGRQQRTDPKFGNVYDHFTVFYEYPTGQHVYFTCRQQDGTTVRVDERVLGSGGQAEILAHQIRNQKGEQWRYEGPKPSMYHVEHRELFNSIREGEPINDGHYMCNSTMIGVMGRMAAYSGKTLSWEDCFNSDVALGPDEYRWSDAPEPQVKIPGKPSLS